ncbi:hypothetical protein [Kineosporia sp. R_H_3]|uniref:hypothetical protein n=1 Tax=Kineosporia sp. R_H_3 TaxID=1961848 RepID=UPI000B4BD390|nr:hypothetical protein [Kineosporia sp. R_H_3]
MPSQQESTSPSWRAASEQWERARKAAGALRRAGAEIPAETLMATVAAALKRELDAALSAPASAGVHAGGIPGRRQGR